MDEEIVHVLKRIVGEENVIKNGIDAYIYDETPKFILPEPSKDVIVVKPGNTKEISEIMKFANRRKIPVIVRGGGTGLSGGVIPIQPSIIISMERLNKIIEIDEDNLMVVCEAGVTLHQLLKTLERVPNLSFPPHPGDESATIGGLVVNNSGGARAVKYGIMRNYVVGLEVVLPDGKILKLGGKVIKNATGYDLLHLIIGSEGTLCIVTKVILRLLPEIGDTYTLVIPFNRTEDAIKSVPEILKKVMPMAIEYIEREAIKAGEKATGKKWPSKEGNADLMVIIDGKSEEELMKKAEMIEKIVKEYNAIDVYVAISRKEQRDVLEIRSLIYEGLKDETIEVLDVSVPPASIAEYVEKCKDKAESIGIRVLHFGHAGDGNVHQQIMKSSIGDWKEKYEEFKSYAFETAMKLGGYITAEHGIGIVKKRDMTKTLPKRAIELMKEIKRIFDPNNILNPGKVVDLY